MDEVSKPLYQQISNLLIWKGCVSYFDTLVVHMLCILCDGELYSANKNFHLMLNCFLHVFSAIWG